MSYAVLFPGQGSQSVGMLSAQTSPLIEQTWAEASEALGWDLAELVREGPEDKLNQTEFTQPALLAAGVAVWRVWQAQAPAAPGILAGHSLGEYAALVAAESIGFADALRIVQLRGQLMQAAVPAGTGGMAAIIGMEDEAVEVLCKACPEGVLEPANFNAPGQVVVAGQLAALDWLDANGKAQGARMVKRLAMSVPSHCSMMRNAASELAKALAAIEVKAPAIPVLHNLDAAPRDDADSIRSALESQLFSPVRWTQTIQALAGQGTRQFFECGPGKVLVGLNKRIDKSLESVSMEDDAGLQAALGALG